MLTLRKKAVLSDALWLSDSGIENVSRYRCKTIPTAGAVLKDEDTRQKQERFEV